MTDRRASAHGAALAAYELHYGNGSPRLPREVVAAFLYDYERLRGGDAEPHPRVALYPDTLGSETIAAYERERAMPSASPPS